MKNFKIITPDNEARAFAYQQIQDLHKMGVPGGTSVAVIFRKKSGAKKSDKSEYEVELQVEGLTEFDSQGHDSDIFEACRKARQELEKKLTLVLENLPDQNERAQLIDSISRGQYLH